MAIEEENGNLEEPNAFVDTLFDDSVLPKYQEKVTQAVILSDKAQDLFSKLGSIKTLYFGIRDSSFTKYIIIFDDQKYDIQSLVDSKEFKDTFLCILETKFNETMVLLKSYVEMIEAQ